MRHCLALLAAVFLSTAAGAATLSFERDLDDGPSFTAYLVSYASSGLKVHAMVAVPKGDVPADGFPVVVANHGYVPDPRKYGVTAEGVDSRPGDYYRSVPELYASRGFLVVMPDYRGHNSSEGFDLIKDRNAESVSAYADDVLALLPGIREIEGADTDRVYLWSHSMGGAVSMRVLLATDSIKAASFWSTMSVGDLSDRFGEIDGPVMIQHAIGDSSTDHSNSVELVETLEALGHAHVFHRYESDDHFFEGEMRELAAERDAEFFLSAVP